MGIVADGAQRLLDGTREHIKDLETRLTRERDSGKALALRAELEEAREKLRDWKQRLVDFLF